MDMTDQERNETPVASFNHRDPYEESLVDETPAPAETPAPEVDNTPEPVVAEGEPAPPPSNPITMKDSLVEARANTVLPFPVCSFCWF